MISGFDPGALLATSYPLEGARVRLRMVASSDGPAVRALVAGCGCVGADFVAERLLRFDPRRRAVVCATALLQGAEVMVGIGAIDLDARTPAALPNPLLIDERAPEGVADLLAGALLGRAQMLARTRAA